MKAGLIKVFCHNCKNDITAYRNEKGVMKYQCPHCGAVNVSAPRTRRKIVIELYAPPDLDDDDN